MTCSTRLPNIPRPDASDVSPPSVTARDRLPEHVRASEGADVRADDGLRTRNLLLGLQLSLTAKDEERVSTLSSTPSRIRTDALLIESQGSLATRRWEQEPSRSTTAIVAPVAHREGTRSTRRPRGTRYRLGSRPLCCGRTLRKHLSYNTGDPCSLGSLPQGRPPGLAGLLPCDNTGFVKFRGTQDGTRTRTARDL